MSNLIDITEVTDRDFYLKDLDQQIEGLKEALEPRKDSKLWGYNGVQAIERKYMREELEVLLKERAMATSKRRI